MMTGRRGWRSRRTARSANVSARASCGNPHLLFVGAAQRRRCSPWVIVRLFAVACLGAFALASCRNMVPLDGWQRQNEADLQLPPTGPSATADGGGVGQLAREVQQLPHGILAVGRRADPQREVIRRDRAEIAVISLAALVTAVRGLELQ